jgi:hypothetical protein
VVVFRLAARAISESRSSLSVDTVGSAFSGVCNRRQASLPLCGFSGGAGLWGGLKKDLISRTGPMSAAGQRGTRAM